ncbi:MAG: type II toxin-antitoxin system RelE/ParE family toxin [Syntrophorhabdus sp.]|jgi:mRNA-degrading endonuclease RelE of RelBE toxin-antitoxin system|nr:type II toxin-antitoxin system RelE/ParE family toxin [Syntrophorhabdus sp.]
MTRILKFKRSVQGDLKRIGKETTREIMKEIRKNLLPNPKAGKPLKGKDGTLWSHRVGDHGIIYTFNDNELYVLVIRCRAQKGSA